MTTDLPLEERELAPAVTTETRPMYWSIRRELWENRSLTIAPLVVTGIVLFASLIATFTLPHRMRTLATVAAEKQHETILGPLAMAPSPIMLVSFLVGFFYALDALYSERRDRSLLFWKSLPVSDRTTVLSKAAIPLALLPLQAFVLSLVTVLILLFAGTVVLLGSGLSPVRLWSEYELVDSVAIMFYGLAVHTLWFAPIYAWFLFVSGWVRRAPIVWAVLPFLVIAAVERIVANSTHFLAFIGWRFMGAMKLAFISRPGSEGEYHRLTELSPLRFLSSPGLWLGLVVAAALIAAAIRIRRNREPI